MAVRLPLSRMRAKDTNVEKLVPKTTKQTTAPVTEPVKAVAQQVVQTTQAPVQQAVKPVEPQVQQAPNRQANAEQLKQIIEQRQAPVQEPQVNNLELLKQAQQAQAIAGLEKARQQGLSAISEREAGIQPLVREGVTQARTSASRAGRSIADILATQGLAGGGGMASGANIRGLSNVQTARQAGESGAILAGQQAQQDVARDRALLEQTYAQDVAGARAGIEAQALQNMIEQGRFDQQLALQRAGLTGMLDGQQTLAGQAQEFGQQFNLAQLAETQRQFDANFGENQRQFEANYGLNLRQQTFAETQAQVQNALAQGRLNIQQAQQALSEAKFYADNDPNSLDNQMKMAQLEGMQLENQLLGQAPTVDVQKESAPVIDQLNRQFITKDPLTGEQVIDKQSIFANLDQLLENGSISDESAIYLSGLYGITEDFIQGAIPGQRLNPNLIGFPQQ